MLFSQRKGRSHRYELMFNGDQPFTTKLEQATVMFLEPSEVKDEKSCCVSPVFMAKVAKAYKDLDETYSA